MYVSQGRLVLKDFDIRKEAGGSSFRVVLWPFKGVVVSENYLEVHLFWAGKGTCCIPASGTYGPSISAFTVMPGNEAYADRLCIIRLQRFCIL